MRWQFEPNATIASRRNTRTSNTPTIYAYIFTTNNITQNRNAIHQIIQSTQIRKHTSHRCSLPSMYIYSHARTSVRADSHMKPRMPRNTTETIVNVCMFICMGWVSAKRGAAKSEPNTHNGNNKAVPPQTQHTTYDQPSRAVPVSMPAGSMLLVYSSHRGRILSTTTLVGAAGEHRHATHTNTHTNSQSGNGATSNVLLCSPDM